MTLMLISIKIIKKRKFSLSGRILNNFFAAFKPEASTSLCSDTVVEYGLDAVLSINIQNYGGNTTSDHIPIISVISTK